MLRHDKTFPYKLYTAINKDITKIRVKEIIIT